jgi:hypothetical protein
MSMNHRVSLCCWESALSPVRMASSSGSPVTGNRAFRVARTMASVTWVVRDSWGRYAAENGAKGPRWVVSKNSTLPGDSSSTIWKSESWRKLRIEPSEGGRNPSGPSRTTWPSPGAYSRRSSLSTSRIVRTSVVVGVAPAGEAIPRTATAASSQVSLRIRSLVRAG